MGEEVKNCWEYHNESARLSRNCVVFKRKAGDCCFFYNQHKNKGKYAVSNYGTCIKCPWYDKVSNTKDKLFVDLWTCIDCGKKFDETQLDKEKMFCYYCKSRSIVRDDE